nr:hypothetical protein TEA_021038 [Ipomoea trifida]
MAVGLKTGVPWIMCKQEDAPDPIRPTTMEEILSIEIKPGWKKGTKITFPEKGNEQEIVDVRDTLAKYFIDEWINTLH